MAFFNWFAQNWLDSFQSLAIVVSLFSTAYTIRRDSKTRKLANAIEITKMHRELWSQFGARPELQGLLDDATDPNSISEAEREFTGMLILHLKLVHRSINQGLYVAPSGLDQDIRSFFSQPKPRMIWDTRKHFYEKDFVRFVESRCCRTHIQNCKGFRK